MVPTKLKKLSPRTWAFHRFEIFDDAFHYLDSFEGERPVFLLLDIKHFAGFPMMAGVHPIWDGVFP